MGSGGPRPVLEAVDRVHPSVRRPKRRTTVRRNAKALANRPIPKPWMEPNAVVGENDLRALYSYAVELSVGFGETWHGPLRRRIHCG